MAENSKIEWTTHTFNPWIGCQKVSPGCDHCYAESLMDKRWGKVQWGPHGERKRTSSANWKLPLRWAHKARLHNATLLGREVRPRVFCASLADWLDNQVPQQWRIDLALLIHATPELDWLLLTKRIENFRKLSPWPVELPTGGQAGFPSNVWLGASAENQEMADRRGRILREIPATVRFLSCEPLLSDIAFETETLMALDWIIVGGESGHGARHMHEGWAMDIRDQCKSAGVHFFMKQMTNKQAIPPHLMIREFPRETARA